MATPFRIAVIPGDGIGKEVMPEGVRVLDAAAKRFKLQLQWQPIEWASCDWYAKHGQMMPDDWRRQLEGVDALYFGAVGWPATVPDHVSLWGSLIKFRRDFDQYINLRPARLFDGVPCPLAGRKPGDIDIVIVRENTEGEYSAVGGRLFEGTEREMAMQQSIFTRKGVDRILKYAFELAMTRPRRKVTSATKSNGIAITMPYWDERFKAMAAQYPQVGTDQYHIDGLTIQLVLNPQRFDVIVASNLFGDIISDIGPATAGTIGIAPSANINPERAFPSLFEPVHGSAPDIYGRNIANPYAMIMSGQMLMGWLGRKHKDAKATAAAELMQKAVTKVIGDGKTLTPDLGGKASTTGMGDAIAAAL
jgi:tartrate dehydrogenase/decarboxylase/D-malate dehydrogenase